MKTPNFFTALTAFILLTLPISAQQAAGEPVKYKDFRVSVGGGYAYRMGEIQKTGDVKIDDLNSQLWHGFALDADAHYFFKQGWGLGLNANYCSTNTS